MHGRQLGILTAVIATLSTFSAPAASLSPLIAPAASTSIFIGARAQDESFATVNSQTGPVKVTRLFYSGSLPKTFNRQGIPAGVKLIISYKTPDTGVAAYAKSIPAGQDVELAYHHEPEGDYPSGATFVAEFNRQAGLIHAANRAIPVAFIAGMYQYKSGLHGYDGSFIPTAQDRSYADSYLPTAALIVPAQTEVRLTRYRALLASKGKTWDGFTEYGRGVIRDGAAFDQAVATKRASVIPIDAQWLATTQARVWAYWYTTDLGSGDQWRFTDAASLNAWRTVAAAH